MLGSEQNWEIFGYDTRQLGRHWIAAWQELLWADDSPVRQRLDEVVLLHSENGTQLYHAGAPCAQSGHACEAVLLPEEMMLARHVKLPVSADAYLDTALDLEANANSPFASSDTACGWRIVGGNGKQLDIVLVIVSISSVMAYLGRQYDIHDPHSHEIWVSVEGAMVVIRGFGEKARDHKYRRRLVRAGVSVGACALMVLLIFSMAAGSKRAELMQLEESAAAVQKEAAAASRMRSSLAQANETVGAVNEIIASYPNPHLEIARLTALLGDEVFINQFSMDGREIRLRGQAVDAASVMQILNDDPAYAEVTAPQAIVKLGNTGLEQFSLNIALRNGAAG